MRKSRRRERQQEIANAALGVVGQYGLDGATMARIGDAVGIRGPALYKHFSGRLEIIEAAMDANLARVVSWLESSRNPNAIERLRELGATHASTMAADYETLVPLFEFAAAGPRLHLTQKSALRQRVVLAHVVSIIDQGLEQGTIRPDVDVQVAAWNFLGLMMLENMSVLEGVQEFIGDGVSARMLDRYLADLAVPSGSGAPISDCRSDVDEGSKADRSTDTTPVT